jgi:hypothetical protein
MYHSIKLHPVCINVPFKISDKAQEMPAATLSLIVGCTGSKTDLSLSLSFSLSLLLTPADILRTFLLLLLGSSKAKNWPPAAAAHEI